MGVLSAAFFILLGITFQRLVLDPQAFFQENALIICENSSKIFLVRDGIKHALPDIEQSLALGFKLDRVVEVSCTFADSIPEGDEVLNLPEFIAMLQGQPMPPTNGNGMV